jgi:micrococcal nuclease
MKKFLLIILFIPSIAFCQKIKVNEIDKFIKQRRIETTSSVLKSGLNLGLSITLKAVGSNYFVVLNGHGAGAGTIGMEDQAIFLLDNDSTVTIQSTGIQSYEIIKDQNTYKHQYKISLPGLEALSKHNLKSLRKYDFKGYANFDILSKNQDELKNLSAIFLKELESQKMLFNQTTVKLEDISNYVGDSVNVCGKIFSGRYLQANDKKPTLLNVGAAYPNQLLTVVIYGVDRQNFEDAPEYFYKEKEVCISGVVELYNNKPQIVVRNKNQLTIKEELVKMF